MVIREFAVTDWMVALEGGRSSPRTAGEGKDERPEPRVFIRLVGKPGRRLARGRVPDRVVFDARRRGSTILSGWLI